MTMLIGILAAVLGLILFMVGGALTNNAPGIQRNHAMIMALGFILLMVGLVMTVRAAV